MQNELGSLSFIKKEKEKIKEDSKERLNNKNNIENKKELYIIYNLRINNNII